ncbi:MAG: hypothetical protein KDA17_07770, partial [Candidatus Saccharibacteria bacterium]|nr:hypothetical protein [Candidatus Saccharibacteria bacterium]
NQVNNVSDISVDYTVDTSDTSTLDGNKFTVQTGMSATVTLTLLDNDIASLAVLLPQYYVAQGEALSTGETVGNAAGAIDVVAASCTTSDVFNQLDVYACGTNAQVLRLVNCRTQIESIDVSDGIRTVAVQFIGEPASGEAVVQFLADDETFVS